MREKVPTYNYLCNQSKKTGPCGHVYIPNINLFWFFPTSPLPNRNRRFLICPFQRVFKISIFNSKKKEKKKERKKMYRIVSCRVANARVGYRIKCFVEGMMKEKK